jgi:uncharacterized FlaG/YvyC family protein
MRFMEVPAISPTNPTGSQLGEQSDPAQIDSLRNAFAALTKLNSVDMADHEFAVVRDLTTQDFVIVIREASTGVVLDQFPPEDILKMLTQLASTDTVGMTWFDLGDRLLLDPRRSSE